MVDAIAATSLLRNRPLCGGGCSFRDVAGRRKPLDCYRLPSMHCYILGKRANLSLPSLRTGSRVERLGMGTIRALAMELTKEAYVYREKERIPGIFKYQIGTDLDLKVGVWPPPNRADNPSLHNPLLRQERMGCGWVGAIFEWEGVMIEDNPDLEKQAWLALSQEEAKSPPLAFILKRIEGMKNEQAISEVLCWSRDPSEMRRLASRKEEIYQALQGGIYRFRSGSKEFVNILTNYKIPMALVSTRPKKTLENAVVAIGIEGYFSVIIGAEDVHRGKPDPEMFMYAAQSLNFIPERCIVFGNSNQTIEAAHDARMKCVAVASKHPVYELGAADLVVRRLDELSIVDLKNLADLESAEVLAGEPEVEREIEEEADVYSRRSAGADDIFW